MCYDGRRAQVRVCNPGERGLVYFHDVTAPTGPGHYHYRGFAITLRHTTFCRSPLDGWSVWSRDLYLTTHTLNTHKRQTSMAPSGGIRTRNPSRKAAARLRPRGHWDRRRRLVTGLRVACRFTLKGSWDRRRGLVTGLRVACRFTLKGSSLCPQCADEFSRMNSGYFWLGYVGLFIYDYLLRRIIRYSNHFLLGIKSYLALLVF